MGDGRRLAEHRLVEPQDRLRDPLPARRASLDSVV